MKSLISLPILFLFGTLLLTCFHEDQLGKLNNNNKTDFDLLNINVQALHPGVNALNVYVGTTIKALFDDNIDLSTVSSSTFIINDGETSGEYSYDNQTGIVTFTPATELDYDTVYKIVLTTGIKNLAGSALAQDYYWSFTTAASPVPNIYITTALNSINTGGTWNYGSVLQNYGKEKEFTITNSGNSDLAISDVEISGHDHDQFKITDYPESTISQNSSSTLAVDFKPSSPGLKNAVLTITSNDQNYPEFIINLTGTGLETDTSEMQITFNGSIIISDSTEVYFGLIPRWSSKDLTLVMSNIGSSNLIITDVFPGGNNPDMFSTDFTPKTIEPGASEEFTITFNPAWSRGMKMANIVFEYNNGLSPFIVKVRGRGF